MLDRPSNFDPLPQTQPSFPPSSPETFRPAPIYVHPPPNTKRLGLPVAHLKSAYGPEEDQVVGSGVDEEGPQLMQGNETVSHTSTQHQLVMCGCLQDQEDLHELVTGWQIPRDSEEVVVVVVGVVDVVAVVVVAGVSVPKGRRGGQDQCVHMCAWALRKALHALFEGLTSRNG